LIALLWLVGCGPFVWRARLPPLLLLLLLLHRTAKQLLTD
jgi:type IV secretory pathway TrbD component